MKALCLSGCHVICTPVETFLLKKFLPILTFCVGTNIKSSAHLINTFFTFHDA
jgi:hypothetical protein